MAQIYPAPEGALRGGGRAGSRTDPQSALALCRTRTTRHPEEIAKEINGYAIDDVNDPTDPTKVLVEKGKQVAGFAQLRDDGTTACGCWIYSGCFNENGNNMARRDNSRSRRRRLLSEMGVLVAGQPPHPLQSRFGGPERQCLGSEPQAHRVGRREVGRLRRPRHRADGQAGRGRAVHHEPGGDGAPVHPGHDARRAVPGALRAVRIADRQPDRAEHPRQSGRARLQGRHGAVRRRRRTSPMRRRPTG